jgi:hypothetical protein
MIDNKLSKNRDAGSGFGFGNEFSIKGGEITKEDVASLVKM